MANYKLKFKQKQKLLLDYHNELVTSSSNYLELLKVIGNNHKYNLNNQISIATFNSNSTACAKFDFWSNTAKRIIKKNSVGIPIFNDDMTKILYHVFDIGQTISTKYTDERVVPWSFDENKDLNALDNLCQFYSVDPSGLSTEEKISSVILENLSSIQSGPEKDFLFEALNISIHTKLGIPYAANEQIILSNDFDRDQFYKIFSYINYYNRKILDNLFKEMKILKKEKERSIINERNSSNVRGQSLSQENSRSGSDLLSDEENDVLRKAGRSVHSGGIQGDTDVISSRNESENDQSSRNGNAEKAELLGKNEIEIPEGEQTNDDSGDFVGGTGETTIESSINGIDDEQSTIRTDDLSKSGDSELENEESSEIYENGEYDKTTDTRDNSEGIDLRLVFSEDRDYKNPKILLTDSIKNYVPKLYATENIPLSDVPVYAMYYVPFQDFTWYMTEYDPVTNEAFGLVTGPYSEWGYFNLNELKANGAIRFISKDFPSSFRELLNTDLKNQFYPDEIHRLFSGQLDQTIPYISSVDITEAANIDTEKEKEVEQSFDIVDTEDKKEFSQSNLDFSIEPEEKYKNFDFADIPDVYLVPSERLKNNIEAIKLLKTLKPGDVLSHDQQVILSKYVGWGGLADVFDTSKTGQWQAAREFLEQNLTKEEFEAARSSTLTSFYTPNDTVKGIYKALNNFGFKKGKILEPCCATGKFLGNMPGSMQKSEVFGVELDTISSSIASYLFPDFNIENSGFEKTVYPDNYFDVVVGNVPFGDYKIFDEKYNKMNLSIHNYFFAKSIDQVKKGGIIAFVTSSSTLDSIDTSFREYLGTKCEFIGAIRLPDDSFKNTGTSVMSDVIFLKKREKEITLEEAKKLDFIKLNTENGITCNEYFIKNKEMVAGNLKTEIGRFGETLVCEITDDYKEKFNTAIESLSATYKEKKKEEELEIGLPIPAHLKEDFAPFTFAEIDNEIYFRENNLMYKQDLSNEDKDMIIQSILIRKTLLSLFDKQLNLSDDEDFAEDMKLLNVLYDKFEAKFGFINSKSVEKVLGKDNYYSLLTSLEELDKDRKVVGKTDIFTKRTIGYNHIPEFLDNAEEALILSVTQLGTVDFDYMSKKLKDMPKNEILHNLQGKVFFNLSHDNLHNYYNFKDFVTADEYLSGNVKEKMKKLESFMNEFDFSNEPELRAFFEYQRDTLSKHIPLDIPAEDIKVDLGATWIPVEYYRQFAIELYNIPHYARDDFDIEFSSVGNSEYSVIRTGRGISAAVEEQYGTPERNMFKILESTLNLKTIDVFDTFRQDGKTVTKMNVDATMAAREKQDLLRQAFSEWIFKDFERRQHICKIYNDRFNNIKLRNFNGEHLEFSGMNKNIELRPHQYNAVARILYGGNTLLAHTVGAGKTFVMGAAAMESKRLGLCNKSMVVVPNHLTEQIGSDFLKLYPNSRVLVSTKKDFQKKNRKSFINRIATSDVDIVVIGHSQFERIPLSKDIQLNYLQEELEELTNFLEDGSEKNRLTVKRTEKFRKKIQKQIDEINSIKDEDVIPFDRLGVDRLFVDEAHMYKNLKVVTKLNNVNGINTSNDSRKAKDMDMKVRYLNQKTGYKGVVFSTGTPVSNNLSELFTMQMYLQKNVLEKSGLDHFDDWATAWTNTTTQIELKAEGQGYTTKTRISEFKNIPELLTMFKLSADIQTAETLDLPLPKANYINVISKPSEFQKKYMKELANRAENVRANPGSKKEDNMLVITNDGKKMALDERIIDKNSIPDPDCKVNQCIDNVFGIWDKTKAEKSTQLIFCDQSVPTQADKNAFCVYDEIRDKLIERGVPEKEIAFIHDYNTDEEKEKLFASVREGEIRVLIGSTEKMGAGTNVQDKLIALHDLDVPWRPSDLEQRSGRIIRQGNSNEEVFVYRYITEDTFDAYLWQTLERKQKFISQIMVSGDVARNSKDFDDTTLSYAEIKCLATGNPLIKRKIELEIEVNKLESLKNSFNAKKFNLETEVKLTLPENISKLESTIEKTKADLALTQDNNNNKEFSGININGKIYFDKKEAGIAFKKAILSRDSNITFRGLDVKLHITSMKDTAAIALSGQSYYVTEFSTNDTYNMTKLQKMVDEGIAKQLASLEESLESQQKRLNELTPLLDNEFDKKEELENLKNELNEIDRQLEIIEDVPKKAKDIVDDWNSPGGTNTGRV